MIDRKPDWLAIPIKTPFTLTMADPPESPIIDVHMVDSPPPARETDLHAMFTRMYDNLRFVETWDQYEVLMLLRMNADLWTVTHDWLVQFREDLDIVNDGSR